MLAAASASGAARRGCSSAWTKYSSAPSSHGRVTGAVDCQSRAVSFALPTPTASQPSSAIVSHVPRRTRSVSVEEEATRAAEFRLAKQGHVGPHHGPGSGAPLNFMISKMRSSLERLETFRDQEDSDEEEDT